jgi:O-antigen ligase
MTTKPTRKDSRAFGWDWLLWILEAGLLFVLPLVFYRGFAEQFTDAKIVLTEFLVFLALAGWGLGWFWGKTGWPAGFRLGTPLVAFAAAILLSCFASSVPSFSLGEAEYFLCGPLWLLLLASWRRGIASAQSMGKLITAAGALTTAIALLQWWGHDPLLFGGYSVQWGTMVPRMRLYSTFGNPNFLCGYLIGAIFPALALALTVKSRIGKVLCGGASAAMLAAIGGTGSYGGWAALAAVAGLVLLRAGMPAAQPRENEVTRAGTALPVFAVPIGALAAWWIASADQTLSSRIAGRAYLSRIAWRMFAEHPLLGSGWGTFQLRFLEQQARFLAAHPDLARYWTMAWELHNDPLQLLVETGLLGFAAFAWLLLKYGREVLKAARAADSRATLIWLSAGAGGAAAVLADSLVNFQFAVAPTLILLFTFLAFPYLLGSRVDSPPPRAGKKSKRPASGNRAVGLRTLGGIGAAALCAVLLLQAAQRAWAERDYERGINLEARGDWQGAEQVDRHGLSQAPHNGKLHFALARVLYLQREYEPALSEAELGAATYSDSHLVVLKARILDHMGRGALALENYRHALALDPTLKTVQPDIERLENSLGGKANAP